MSSSYLRSRSTRSWAAGAWRKLAMMACLITVACGDAGDSPLASDEQAPASETTGEERSGPEADTTPGVPASRLQPSAAGCTGTCQQVCDCVAATCQRDGVGSCTARAEECRAGCERATCSAGEPACWGLPPGGASASPDDPDPPRPGPGPDPDPSPVDARGNPSSSGSSAAQGQGAGSH